MKRRKRDEYKWSKIALKLIITHGRSTISIFLLRCIVWSNEHLYRKRRRSVKGERKPSLSDPSDSGHPDRVQLVILSVSSLSPSSVRFNGRLDRVPVISCRYFVPCCVSLYYRVSLSTRFLLNFGISTPDVGRNDR